MGLTKVNSGGIEDGSIVNADVKSDAAIAKTKLAALNIGASDIADNAVGLAQMAGGTDGQIITYDASGDPVAVGPGTDGQVLTSTGAGSPPAFEDAAAGGKVLQVVQEVRTSTWSVIVGGSTYSSAAISKAITTSSSSSKVLVFVNVNVGYEGGDDMGFALYRGGSVVSGYTGNAASNRMRVASQTAVGNVYQQEILTGCYLDSPGSAAAHTYDIRLYYRGASGTDRYIHVNKANDDGDTYDKTRSASSLTLIEVSA